MKLPYLVVYFFPLFFSNELIVKCVIWFVGFVKISKDPWQLMIELDHFEIFNIIRFFISCSYVQKIHIYDPFIKTSIDG
jgi:hypothetical protein